MLRRSLIPLILRLVKFRLHYFNVQLHSFPLQLLMKQKKNAIKKNVLKKHQNEIKIRQKKSFIVPFVVCLFEE